MEEDLIEKAAFHLFAQAHPREAYREYPERFWAWFRELFPGVPREEMERMLGE